MKSDGRFRRTPSRRALLRAAWSVLIAILTGMGLLILLAAGAAEKTREGFTDRALPSVRADPSIVVVAIDRNFLAWAGVDGSEHLLLATLLARSGADSVVLDGDWLEVANPGLDEGDLVAIVAENYRSTGFDSSVAYLFDVVLAEPRQSSRIPSILEWRNDPAWEGAVGATGLDELTGGPQEDVVRTVALVAETPSGSAIVPSTALVVALTRDGLVAEVRETADGLLVGDELEVPTEDLQRLRLTFAPDLLPGGSQVRPAREVLEELQSVDADPNRALADWLSGSVVVLAVSDPSQVRYLPAPVGEDGQLPAGIIRANAANTLLTRQFLRPVAPVTLVGVGAGLAFVVAFLALSVPGWLTPLAPVLLGLASWYGAARSAEQGWLADPTVALLAIGVAFVAALSIRATSELRHRRRVAGLFAQYVPPTVARELMEQKRALTAAAGQRLTVTALFCDLRGFTSTSAELEPTAVRQLLDRFYDVTSRLVLEHGGTVMKYVGDEIFAVFGAPLPDDHHARSGLACARAMLEAAPDLNRTLEAEHLPEIHYGIGLHCGEVVAAHVGSSVRRQYDVVGDPINVASRLCSEAGPGEIVTSEDLVAEIDDRTGFEEIGILDLKGVTAEVVGYRLSLRG